MTAIEAAIYGIYVSDYDDTEIFDNTDLHDIEEYLITNIGELDNDD